MSIDKKFYFNLEVIKSGKSDNNEFFVEGYAATSDLDRQGDVIALSALEDAAPRMIANGQTVFFNHDYNRCVGRLDAVDVDSKGLKVKIYVSEWEEELRKKIAEGIINKFSIGGRVVAGEKVHPSEAVARLGLKSRPSSSVMLIEKMDLFEVSIVGLPANSAAEFVQKSLYQALKDADVPEMTEVIEKKENLGQIPDNTSSESLPKPVTIKKETEVETVKSVNEEVVMEQTEKTQEAQPAETTEVVKAVEVETPAPAVEAPAAEAAPVVTEPVVEKAAEVPAAEEVIEKAQVVTTEQHVETVVTTHDTEKPEVKQEVASVDKVVTELPDGSKETQTVEAHVVRTYTFEEVQEIQASHQKQLAEKDAMIQSLSAELESEKLAKAQLVAPKEKLASVSEPAAGGNEEVVGKSTPLVETGIKPAAKEVVADPSATFLKLFKGIKK